VTLYAELQKAHTEEDVKGLYIKALGLKNHSQGFEDIDIRTKEIWFEAKSGSDTVHKMFTQLIAYVRHARLKGKHIPPFLAVIDREKAALMETVKIMPVVEDKAIKWSKIPSQPTKESIAQVAPRIEAHFVVYDIKSHEKEFIQAVKIAIKEGKFIRTPITPDNLRQVFDKWVEMIGTELEGVNPIHYALLFFADIMHDGKNAAIKDLPARLLQEDGKPVFLLEKVTYPLSSDWGYRRFWQIYDRPPEEEHRHYLLERRDSLLPLDERSFKGAYYTPLHIVDKAYDLLTQTLGKNWQKNYIVWDMCCGVGNLEVKHNNDRNIFMSTLDKADIDVMVASHTCVAATKFQYDYLNDDIGGDGEIDYSLTNKMPKELRQAIADAKAGKKGAKKILVLINPPYGEATTGDTRGGTGKNKTDIASTKIGAGMNDLGYASRELFVQFLVRISKELPKARVAMFSTLKYINAPNFEAFRAKWKAEYLGGFVVHSKAFDGLKGDFPIGFLVWDTSKPNPVGEIITEALDKEGYKVGSKSFYRVPSEQFLSGWLPRLKTTTTNIPLKNAVAPQTGHAKVVTWHEGAIGYLLANSNDMQNAGTLTSVLSSVYSAGNGFYITPGNLWQVGIVFSVRRLIKPTWLNDRDQFLQASVPIPEGFKNDCLIWMLFNNSNLSAGANALKWDGADWPLVNRFIPFTEKEVAANGRFESAFMSSYLAKLKLSDEAKLVMSEGRKLWRKYHATSFEKKIRDEFKLNRPDVGWYQIRMALEANSRNEPVDFTPFKSAYDALGEKLRPQVYSLGFLK
jgi:hypothetical protein